MASGTSTKEQEQGARLYAMLPVPVHLFPLAGGG